MTLVLPVPMQQTSLPHPSHLLPPAMSTSFAISPSPRPSQPCSHLRTQRPKLTINTQQNRTFGKGSSLRLETLSAVSPTARNTFQNAYETNRVQIVSTPLRLSFELPESPTTPDPADGRTPSSSSISSASTFSDSGVIPYTLPHSTSSILVNSPIPRVERPRFSMCQSRPIFPTDKHVAFRSPLEEEIKTTRYVWKHSDIESEAVSSVDATVTKTALPEATMSITPSIAEVLSAQESIDYSCVTPSDLSQPSTTPTEPSLSSPPSSAIRLSFRPSRSRLRIRSPKTGDKRDSSSESDSDSCPETPVAGRRKRRREWVWTLGPIPSCGSESQDVGHASTEGTESSDLAAEGSTPGPLGEEQSSNYSEHTDSTCASSRNSSESNAESSVTSDGSVDEAAI